MVHLMVYADVLDIEGLIASPSDEGRKRDILKVIQCYEQDYPNLKTYSDRYLTPDAYQYIVDRHPTLWMTESNATYRSWFSGGNQSSDWDNERFVSRHIQGQGSLGDFFVRQKADIKMGDSPSVSEGPHSGAKTVSRWRKQFLGDFTDRMRRCRLPLNIDEAAHQETGKGGS
ncbi:hypothetical protein Mal15_45310 [Stieleria maiorica]|uniref:Cellulose-binding Sde182 nucleoside hydrolase-like domain-containing protein n=2 Tax=Stieleria maiorica TaxID=2795974 RepID=A0A5B9MKC7_9BACT|nr:hypothetical protein Mal15_45310 [Stieleria maiorica]